MKSAVKKITRLYGFENPAAQGDFNAREWRDQRPVWDRELCFKCGICYINCPDAAVIEVDEGFYDSDPQKCKGCGICVRECPNDAIAMTAEDDGV